MFDFKHCVKRVRIRSYCGPHFSQIFPHSDWIRRTVVQYYIRGHKGQNFAGTRCRGFLVLETGCCGFLSSEKKPWNHNAVAYLSPFLDVMVFSPRISMSRFFGLGISLSWFFGLGISISWYICLHVLVFVVIVKTKKSRIIISITFWKTFQLSKFMQYLSA